MEGAAALLEVVPRATQKRQRDPSSDNARASSSRLVVHRAFYRFPSSCR